jgi:hypothetical protein
MKKNPLKFDDFFPRKKKEYLEKKIIFGKKNYISHFEKNSHTQKYVGIKL